MIAYANSKIIMLLIFLLVWIYQQRMFVLPTTRTTLWGGADLLRPVERDEFDAARSKMDAVESRVPFRPNTQSTMQYFSGAPPDPSRSSSKSLSLSLSKKRKLSAAFNDEGGLSGHSVSLPLLLINLFSLDLTGDFNKGNCAAFIEHFKSWHWLACTIERDVVKQQSRMENQCSRRRRKRR